MTLAIKATERKGKKLLGDTWWGIFKLIVTKEKRDLTNIPIFPVQSMHIDDWNITEE